MPFYRGFFLRHASSFSDGEYYIVFLEMACNLNFTHGGVLSIHVRVISWVFPAIDDGYAIWTIHIEHN